jgi:hypothetical protein
MGIEPMTNWFHPLYAEHNLKSTGLLFAFLITSQMHWLL